MEVEMATVYPPSLQSQDERAPPASPAKNDRPGVRKSLEVVETVNMDGIQPSNIPLTAVSASTPTTRRRARIQFITLCCTLFLAGWNDGTTGPLLPRIQSVYHANFTVASLIFVTNCIGFVTGAAANMWLTDRLGFGRVMVLGSIAQVIGYCLAAPAPPFPVFVLGYGLNGFGMSLQDAGANGFVACLKDNASSKMSILHAVYGAGALVAPLVATQFAQLRQWSFHYLASLGLALANTIALIVVFRFKTQDAALAESGQNPAREETEENGGNKYSEMFKLKSLHLMAVFILIYIGVEVTLGGWIVTYVIDLRGGGPSAGYISSGFFGGLTLGRIGLLWVNQKVGEHRVIFLYGILAIGLELVVWLVPSLVGGGIAVSFVGVVLGPIYPIVMNHASRILPPRLLTGSIGWMAGFGQAGSAVLPFITGAIASKTGIKGLQPLLVSLMGFMVLLWALVPHAPRRIE